MDQVLPPNGKIDEQKLLGIFKKGTLNQTSNSDFVSSISFNSKISDDDKITRPKYAQSPSLQKIENPTESFLMKELRKF